MDYGIIRTQLPPLQEHPLFTAGMTQISTGQWQQAIKSFQILKELYPDEAEVKELYKQAEMRAALAQFQPRKSSRVRKRLSPRRLLVGVVIASIVVLAAYAAYEIWIAPSITQELHLRQITSLRSTVDEAIIAGDYSRAREALQKLQSILPEDSQTADTLQKVMQLEQASSLYGEARMLMEAGNWDEATRVLTELQSLDAEYRDLSELLQVARESQALEKQYQAAEEAFVRGDWESAITGYQALQKNKLTFRFEQVQARLFEALIKTGQGIMQQAGTRQDQVLEAIAYFSKALKLRPMDSTALNERRLAETYLAALTSGNQDEVIDLLGIVCSERPDYAGNQAAELLYTMLLKRGDSFAQASNQDAAITDYQIAAGLPVKDASEAQDKLSDLLSGQESK